MLYNSNLGGQLSGVSATTYTVKKGDTLWAIAEKFKTTTIVLASSNHMSETDTIYVGQRLLIPGGAGVALPKNLNELLNPSDSKKDTATDKSNTPKKTDWFDDIAAEFKVSKQTLMIILAVGGVVLVKALKDD